MLVAGRAKSRKSEEMEIAPSGSLEEGPLSDGDERASTRGNVDA